MYTQEGRLLYRETGVNSATGAGDGVNYIFLGRKLIAKEGVFSDTGSSLQHYKPFGETIKAPKDEIGYTGHKFDADLELSYMPARYYGPAIGRFYSNDPVGYSGHLNRGNPVHGFGRYTYVNNNPYRYVDPDGEFGLQELTQGITHNKVGVTTVGDVRKAGEISPHHLLGIIQIMRPYRVLLLNKQKTL